MFPNLYQEHIGHPVARKHSNAPRLILVSRPMKEIVSVYDYQAFIKIKENIDQDLILDKIQSARELCEEFTGLIFAARQYDMYYDFIGPFFSGWTNFRLAEFYNIIDIPKVPFVSLQGIWLRDSTGAESQLTTDMYNVSQTRDKARVTINTWPFMEVINYPYIEQLRLRFTCGYCVPVTFTTVSPYAVTSALPHGFSVAGKTPLYNSVSFRAMGTGNTQGVLPAPIAARTDYFAQVVDDYSFTLASDVAGLTPVHTTTTGTGTTFAQLQEGGLPVSINRAILSVASRDRFAADPRSLRKIDAETDMPKEAAAILKRFRKMRVY